MHRLLGNTKITEETIRKIADHISDAIQIFNSSGELVYCNKASSEMDEIELKTAKGSHITELYPSIKIGGSTILQVLKTGEEIAKEEQTYSSYRGQKLSTINTTLPIMEGKKIVGAAEISRNITHFKELNEKMIDLRSASEKSHLTKKSKAKDAKKASDSRTSYKFSDIITRNSEFLRIKEVAKRAAKTNIPILIYGDTGTGKELLAQSVHSASVRSKSAFIAQNCAALPANLLEGILFGTTKGGFTGAVDRPGLFELADTGTMFLDEVNSMPIELQAKLLRVLQDGKIRRVGDTKQRTVDVRLVAAMNRDPNIAIEQGLLRRDLYYRINTVTLSIPSLADRREDIELLTEKFIKKYNQLLYKSIEKVSDEVMELFHHYTWDGNVRELEHAIEAASNFSEGPIIELADLPHNIRNFKESDENFVIKQKLGEGLNQAVETLEKQMVQHALEISKNNITAAADVLQVPRQTLQYKIKKYNL